MVRIFNNKEEITTNAANIFVAAAQNAILERGRFVVALTGGSSPVAVYKLLATPAYQEKIDWEKIFIFWGDERWVPLDDERSNAKMAYDCLLSHVSIPKNNIFPMYREGVTPEDYALEYEKSIKNITGEDGQFDLILLGMGDDGHTASLFPGQAVLQEQHKWVSAYYLEPQTMFRITLTAPLINKAKQILVLTFGENKAHALNEVLHGAYNPEKYPTQLIKPLDGELLFLTDKDATSSSS
ncbi:6-phosphogluconolactonase [Flavobacterium frigoris]|uniref:6-phosphogluconolactonase n=1 Tax=Flavobacterium frigoris (strain PS1) TaxID=1086011 RepID=H7FV84_FLAFP|nr:6-phosphogluconolactonase [Flavobacterium frigoris]EIA07716.1 6-phosphogluconolactonase, eukaryotic type [Flavobacterium frigoris PS1]